MTERSTLPAVVPWLALFLAVLLAQRIGELALSARHGRRLRTLGAREHGAAHFPFLVLIHVMYPIALVCEVLFLGARPGPLWPLWVALSIGAEALRFASIHALGERWHVRILVVPGLPPVRHGPYRWLRHPNYLAVVVELICQPLIFGAWRTALAISALNLWALGIRVRAEDRALGHGVTSPADPGG